MFVVVVVVTSRRVCDLARLIVRKFLDNAMQILQIRYNYFNEAKYFKEREREKDIFCDSLHLHMCNKNLCNRGSTQIVCMLE
jgi:hypothetical protein